MTRALSRAALAGVLLLAGPRPAPEARPLTRVETAADLARGQADGMAVSQEGHLFLAPALSRVGRLDAAQVWSIVADASGDLLLGTGPDGAILRLRSSGEPVLLHALDQPLVTALAIGPDGSLFAGSAPDGLIYRIDREGRARIWAETGERYVWALAVSDEGRIFAGTGERGRILEILPSGDSEVLFDGDESHIVSLSAVHGGDLLAGGGGRGLVYRVDPDGHALVLHDDELPEVVALAAMPDGAVLAAFVASPVAEARRPAVRLKLPDGVEVGTADESLGMLDASSGPTLQGVIEGLTPEAREVPTDLRGRVVRIAPDGAVTEIWRSTREAPFALALDGRGRPLFGTGEPARLYRVEPGGDVALLATLDEAQATGILRVSDSIYLATSNPASIYRAGEAPAAAGAFVSQPFDASGPAHWGTIRWKAEGPSGGAEFYTRTGNSLVADSTWSAWSPALTDASGSAIVNPDGRYLQWRVRQVAGVADTSRMSEVTVDYEPYNRPPILRDFRVEGPSAQVGPLRFRWSTLDIDGDPVDVAIRYRRQEGDSEWRIAAEVQTEGTAGAAGPRAFAVEGSFMWVTDALEEGNYTVRASVTDQPGNPPGDGKSAAVEPELRVILDRTPPRIEVGAGADGSIEVTLEDGVSAIRSLEVRQAGRLSFTARPLDGVADSPVERYRLSFPKDSTGGLSLRGVDAAGNQVESPLPGG